MEKLFDLKIQKEHAEMIINQLNQNKSPAAQQLAHDLNERFIWNYRQSLIK
tara:strand:+ start:3841 stop:3993 length:153 start_codon:yes stop_codon:yes gene_type:complete